MWSMTVTGPTRPRRPRSHPQAITTSPATSGLTETIVLLGIVTVAEPCAVPFADA